VPNNNLVRFSGTSFQFFPGGGKILTYFLGGGAKYEEKNLCTKIIIFQIQGVANAHCPPPK